MYFKCTALPRSTTDMLEVLSPSEIPIDEDIEIFKASLALPVSEQLGFDFPGRSMDFFPSI